MRQFNSSHNFTVSLIALLSLSLMLGCSTNETDEYSKKLFRSLDATVSGVNFRNDVIQSKAMNFFTYQYVLNGGGVAAGDLNGDGLPDLYFTANQFENKLYLNEGNLKFKDVTVQSGAGGNEHWSTGVTIVDVNADGWNDIYVCHAGTYLDQPQKLKNELFINNGDANSNNGIPTFTENASAFGLDGFSRTVQAVFFDFDNDNDLDVYMVNHPYNFWLPFEMRLEAEKNPYPDETDKLLRNDNGKYVDVTKETGVENWAFGLSATIGDLNGDGRMDIFVSNDYSERDNCYINNGDGTFTDRIHEMFFHISNFSMGSDIADYNNDRLPDLMVLDMMAEDNRRKKINMSAMKPSVFWENVDAGRHHQYMQNVLQLNNGNGTFSEVAELADVAFTDWSWSTIFADLDNDGWKDLFITNGLAKDVRNTDANKHLLGQDLVALRENFQEHLDAMPSEPIDNYAYRNKGDLTFEKSTTKWGLNFKGFSNGAVISDLDRDGDLDVVINNLNDVAQIFENSASETANYIQFIPIGSSSNKAGIGLEVTLEVGNSVQTQHVSLARGFQSGSENLLHFGIGSNKSVDKVIAKWPDGKSQILENVETNQRIVLNYADAIETSIAQTERETLFAKSAHQIGYSHQEEVFDDYQNEVLLPHKYSQLGPTSAVADVNKDGLSDVFIGGAKGFAAKLFIQNTNGDFVESPSSPWSAHLNREDVGATFFDADNDGDMDLYVASGSNEWPVNDHHYADRLYLNNGNGSFVYLADGLPDIRESSSCVKPFDFDSDGDLDLFVGGRLVPGSYPKPAGSHLLKNEGGKFKDVTAELAKDLSSIGMVTDAQWLDIDKDGSTELILCGEWMPLTIFKKTEKGFENVTDKAGLTGHIGWWYSLEAADFDNDGDLDLIAGNIGLNTKYKGTIEEPFQVYYDDFDSNGHGDIVLGYAQQGTFFPVRGRSCSSEQIPDLKKKFPSYEEFGAATLEKVYGSALYNALNYKANWMATSIFENLGNGSFKVMALENPAQLSAVKGITILDIDNDGFKDLILTGNLYNVEVETCRHDASIGVILKNNGNMGFETIPPSRSGFMVVGDARKSHALTSFDGKPMILTLINDGKPVIHQLNSSAQFVE